MSASATPARELAARKRLQRASHLLDSRWHIPGTRLRFGLDAIIGLIPVAGDVFGGLLSLWLLAEAWMLRVPRLLLLRMLANALIDVGLGAVPLIGDIFDLLWKNNQRNMQLLGDHLDSRLIPASPRSGSSRWLMVLGCVFCIVVLIWMLSGGSLHG